MQTNLFGKLNDEKVSKFRRFRFVYQRCFLKSLLLFCWVFVMSREFYLCTFVTKSTRVARFWELSHVWYASVHCSVITRNKAKEHFGCKIHMISSFGVWLTTLNWTRKTFKHLTRLGSNMFKCRKARPGAFWLCGDILTTVGIKSRLHKCFQPAAAAKDPKVKLHVRAGSVITIDKQLIIVGHKNFREQQQK